METSNGDLSYNNIYLTKEDYKCFEDHNQLNDMCISFYFEYLYSCLYKEIKNKILLIDPVIVSSIYFDDSIPDLYEILLPLEMNNKDFIFLPINDNTNKFSYGGGTHWALLVYIKHDNFFIYLDSTNGKINLIQTIADKFLSILNYSTNNEEAADLNATIKFPIIEKKQFNSYDCGMFVLEYTEVILKLIQKGKMKYDEFDFTKDFNEIKQENMKEKRSFILRVIKNLVDSD